MYTDPFAHLVKMEEYRNVDQKILEKLPERPKRSHKGMFGKALCIAGSVNMAGAAYLCAGAAYRSGAGLVRILTPEENRVILQTLLPEAVMTTFEQNEREALDNILEEALSWATVAAIGPGLGRKPWAYHMMKLTLQKFHVPLVIDADALNILSEHMEWLEQHEGDVICCFCKRTSLHLHSEGCPLRSSTARWNLLYEYYRQQWNVHRRKRRCVDGNSDRPAGSES